MYFGKPISPRPCPPSPRPCPPSPRTDFNKSRPRSKLRVYNPNSSLRNKSGDSSQSSFLDSSLEESPIPTPQFNFTVENMTLSISPRSSQALPMQNDFFNTAYYKHPKVIKTENDSNPYYPVQPLTDERIEQIKAILKMGHNENNAKSHEKYSETSVIEDQVVDELLTRIETRLQSLAPSYFNTNGSAIPSAPSSSTNLLATSYKLPLKGDLSSPRSPRKLPANLCASCNEFHSLQFGPDLRQKKKLRISRSPSADIEKYIKIDKNGHDDLDRKIIELKGKLNKIAELIKSRNDNS